MTTVFPLMLLSKDESSAIDAMFEFCEVPVNKAKKWDEINKPKFLSRGLC
jgi:hypothetical protein